MKTLSIETELETDGRWIAEIPELPGVMVYGQNQREAVLRAQALALRVIAERVARIAKHTELTPEDL
jgi:predicted RNase H-like HicB family nuclease